MKTEPITYSLSTFARPDIWQVRELSEKEYLKYSKNISSLQRLENNEKLFKIVELNYFDFKTKIEKTIKNLNNGTNSKEFENLYLDINRLILNILSSIRTYLDHSETRIKREYGSESEEFLLFKKETSKTYDENFSYRFLYKLRNYAQHCGLPAGSLSTNANTTGASLKLTLIKSNLLSNYNSWGITVKQELINKTEEFDIIPLIDDKFTLLEEINKNINELSYRHYKDEAQELMNLLWEAQGKNGTPCIIKTIGSGGKLKLNINWFPYKPISKITGIQIDIIE
ncbi:hypothetical protein [Flavobacterium terrisoli]|uniref:hypothetical protein n=1 Tax=Flavobacterium terrisoli TaxID=3242195 RepID=UPI002543A787|nr:hypothetical protein [Flavobacterium buctense]